MRSDWQEINAKEYICHSTPPAEAGKTLADIWLLRKSTVIDMWSRGEVHCKEFFESFWEQANQHMAIDDAMDIIWYFDCQTGSELFPGYVEPSIEVKRWADEFKQKLKAKSTLSGN